MPLFSRFLVPHRGQTPIVGEYPNSQSFRRSPRPQLGATNLLAPNLDDICPLQRYVQMAQEHLSPLPSPYRWLGVGDVKLVCGRPIAAGGFADVYEATYDGRNVVLKSYRPYMLFDAVQVVARFHNEVQICSLLYHGDVDVVPLVGVCSTDAHPFGLVYEYMDGLDLRQHLRNEPNVERLKLLTRIARCLSHMHDQGIVHGNLQATNVLVDKDGTVWIAGLGNASVLPHATARTVPGDRISTNRPSRSRVPRLTWPRMSPDPTEPAHPTKASDIYAFGIMAWEVLTGRPPFFGMTEIAAAHAMLNGDRPSRKDHLEISDRVWYMVQRCWHNMPSKRMSIEEVVNLLEEESGRITDSRP